MVDKIHVMLFDGKRIKILDVTEAVGISTELVHHILRESLDIRNLAPRLVPQSRNGCIVRIFSQTKGHR